MIFSFFCNRPYDYEDDESMMVMMTMHIMMASVIVVLTAKATVC